MADTQPNSSLSLLHDSPSVVSIAVDKIYVRPQYRQNFDHVPELAENIRQNGLQQPIVVFKNKREDGYIYELVSGESRLRAMKLLERGKISASLRPAPTNELERVTLQLSENIQRSDLTHLEIALAADDLRMTFSLERPAIAELLNLPLRTLDRYRAIMKCYRQYEETQRLLIRLNVPDIGLKLLEKFTTLSTVHPRLATFASEVIYRDPRLHSSQEIARLTAAAETSPAETEHLLSQLSTEALDPSPIHAFLEGIEALQNGEASMPTEPPAAAKPKPQRSPAAKTMKPMTYRATQALYQGKSGQVSTVIFIDEDGERHELPMEQVELGLQEVSE